MAWSVNKAKRFMVGAVSLPNRVRTAKTHWLVLGAPGPIAREVIDVDPREIRGHVSTGLARRLRARSGYASGVVIGGEWDREITPIEVCDGEVFRSCELRWAHGYAWQDTPIFQSYLVLIERKQRCDFASPEELLASYERLDGIFGQVRQDGAFSEAFPDLIKVNLDRHGKLAWGPDGRHRVAMALICGLPSIPARPGFIHVHGVEHFRALRRRSDAS